MNTLREAMAMAWSSKRVWLLQFLLNPVLFALGVWWLTIPEARIWQLGLSALLALVVVVGALTFVPALALGPVVEDLILYATH